MHKTITDSKGNDATIGSHHALKAIVGKSFVIDNVPMVFESRRGVDGVALSN